MSYLSIPLLILISILLIAKGADWLTDSLVPIAKKLKTTSIAVALILVSVAVFQFFRHHHFANLLGLLIPIGSGVLFTACTLIRVSPSGPAALESYSPNWCMPEQQQHQGGGVG